MDTSKEAARGLTAIETFLYREAHLRAARRRVTAFTTRAPGLTREQKEDIEQWYLDEQEQVARMVTEHIADSISETEERYHVSFRRWLRGTMTAMVLITLVISGLFVVALGSLGAL
ncbi:hypothetical protein HY68_34470 [Streptomyces sp. AcH 505]|uniref:hypothetical protein n=1 Tax=unclassified Streptomyces TaxID=2593676 RepID=UPI000591C062|nr:hypothetical protein [Streptomyces sp. NBC_00370]KIF66932.1 hypothetical protein HY68_34470 [Streptomyces sp. AcH 505]